MTSDQLSPESTFLIDFNLHYVPAALGIDVPPAAAAETMDIGDSPDQALYIDGLHPGPAGHQLILETLLRTLTKEKWR